MILKLFYSYNSLYIINLWILFLILQLDELSVCVWVWVCVCMGVLKKN